MTDPPATRQGQGAVTLDKERCLASALSISMSIAERNYRQWGFAYWHFDANSGSGWNEDIGVEGSPVVFHRTGDLYLNGMRRRGFFCDIDPAKVEQLERRLLPWFNHRSQTIRGDNNVALLEMFAPAIRRAENPKFAIGTVIVDPNGYWYRNAKGEGAPTGLIKFSREFRKIDIILNLNTRKYKMQLSQHQAVVPPDEVLASLHKAYWLVRLTQAGGDQFLLAVGRNVLTARERAPDFYRLDSREGQEIMARAKGKGEKNGVGI